METITEQKNKITKSFIICKRGKVFIPIKTEDIFLFFFRAGARYAIDKTGNRYLIDKTLIELEQELDRNYFFRISRKIIINIHCIKEFKPIEFGKLSIQLKDTDWYKQDIIVSQANAPFFKEWIYNL